MWLCDIVQSGFKFLGSRDLSISASGVGSTIDAHTQLRDFILLTIVYPSIKKRVCRGRP